MMITAATIRRIRDVENDEFPVISMYVTVPVDVGERSRIKTRVTSLLEQIRPLGEDHAGSHLLWRSFPAQARIFSRKSNFRDAPATVSSLMQRRGSDR